MANDSPAKPEKSKRWHRREERRLRGRVVAQRIRVNPRDDEIRKVLSHPSVGGFRETGSIEWPLDNFTKRRLRDGSVTREEQVDTERRERHRRDQSQPRSE